LRVQLQALAGRCGISEIIETRKKRRHGVDPQYSLEFEQAFNGLISLLKKWM
jgi:hypothetical protein